MYRREIPSGSPVIHRHRPRGPGRRMAAALTALLTLSATALTAGLATGVQAAALSSAPRASSSSAGTTGFGCAHPTSGSNGSCGGSYLCTARPGYDGPTGLGTPDGTGAF